MSDTNDDTTTEVAVKEDVTSVFFNDYHDGASGMELADQGRPTIYKLDHKKGYYFPIDDEDEHLQELSVIIINCRVYYRKFKNNQVVCTSDNGTTGFDTELNAERSCEPDKCEFSYKIQNYPGQGQCGLGMSIQGLALVDDEVQPMQINMSGSSARAFSTYLKKLRRKKLEMRAVLTRMSSKYIRTANNEWYAGNFQVLETELDPAVVKAVTDVVAAQAESEKQLAEQPAGGE
jgi:hypothetical protein